MSEYVMSSVRRWTVFGRPGCGYCELALDKISELSEKQGDKYAYFNVREYPVLKVFMEESGMPMTVPQIYLNGHWLGGYDDVSVLLETLLAE